MERMDERRLERKDERRLEKKIERRLERRRGMGEEMWTRREVERLMG